MNNIQAYVEEILCMDFLEYKSFDQNQTLCFDLFYLCYNEDSKQNLKINIQIVKRKLNNY